MRVCIHRGTKEIGGTCIELEAQGQRLVLDVGLPLNVSASDEVPLTPVSGFATPDHLARRADFTSSRRPLWTCLPPSHHFLIQTPHSPPTFLHPNHLQTSCS